MAAEFELLSPTDKPALVALDTPDALAACKAVLHELKFKVHVVQNHADFLTRFSQAPFQVVVFEERFASQLPNENQSLQSLQIMPMPQRRHAVVLLVGDSFQTLNRMQAYQQSVHAVINRSEIGSLSQIIQQTIADNDLFVSVYRETQLRVAQGKS